MLTLFFFLYLAAIVCFVASFAGVATKLNLLALGLFFFTLVPLLQVGQRVF